MSAPAFDMAEMIAHSRRYLAAEYLHHKRELALAKGYGGEYYHRVRMQHTRRHAVRNMKERNAQ